MPVFFLPSELNRDFVKGDVISITGDDAHHIVSVLRAREGERFTAVSENGFEYGCRYSGFEKSKNGTIAFLTVTDVRKNDTESSLIITVYQGMPKGKKTDQIVQKCVELGASEVVFVYSDRSVPIYENEREEEKKKERLKKIADEASKQCGRGKLTDVRFLKNTEDAVAEMKMSDMSFYLYECEKDKSIKEVLKKDFDSVSFFIGPEGGVSDREKLLFSDAGIEAYSLGKKILRTETAPICTLSMILYEKEL